MERRDFLQKAGAQVAVAWFVSQGWRPLSALGDWGDPQPELTQDLAKFLGEYVLVPGNAKYEDHRISYASRFQGKPAWLALCRSTDDVIECIKAAQRYGVALHVRSGGHSYEGLSTGPGLLVDLSLMNTIDDFDKAAKTAVIGPGTRLGKVYEYFAPYGLALTAGTCPTVGVAGLTLGGGHGFLTRMYGLTCDNLIEADLVSATGTVHTVRANATNELDRDLFWACRGGGGGSLGIVTRFKFQLHTAGKTARCRMFWPDAAQAIKAWQKFAPKAPNGMASALNVTSGEAHSNHVMLGDEATLRTIMEPIRKAAGATAKYTEGTYYDIMKIFFGNDTRTAPFKASSDYFNAPLDDKAIARLLAASRSGPGALLFEAYGGAVDRIKLADSAFAHRGALFCIQYFSGSASAASLNWVKSMRTAMAPYSAGAYVNYTDLDIGKNDFSLPSGGASAFEKAYFGSNIAKLKKIKAAVDPNNFFRHAQSIRA